VQAILPRLSRRVVRYGFNPQADWVAEALHVEGFSMRFRVRERGRERGEVMLPLPGVHNVANALATLAVAAELEVDFDVAARALASFGGIERRFQELGSSGGVRVVDDYAHHPAELRATLASARAAHDGRIVAVFQPHRYSRTHDLFDDFATAFHDADHLVVTAVYAAGEDKIPGAEGAPLAEAIRAHGHRSVEFEADLGRLAEVLPAALRPGDLVLTLGAGDVSRLGPLLLERLSEEST
jgi:UDP-N-acetylmuramate--alanine ligase